MSDISKNTAIQVLLNGLPALGLIEWNDVSITADYSGDNVQPHLTIDAFDFSGEARLLIKEWVANGLNGGVGIFEGMPFQITLFNNTVLKENFTAYLDFTNDFAEFTDDGKLSVSLIKDKGLNNFFNQIDSLTYGYLESIGVINSSDYTNVDYVVEKKVNPIEMIILGIVLYIMIKEFIENTIATTDLINKTVTGNIPTIGVPPSVTIGAIIYAVLSILLRILYLALILIAIINMATQLFEILIQPKRTHKAIAWKTALEKVCTHLGYNLVAPINVLNSLVYLPSNPNVDNVNALGIINLPKGTQKGIPNTLDYGYNCGEMFELAKKTFNAQLAIVNNDVVLRPRNDIYWLQQSLWTLPSVLLNKLEYNTSDLKSTKIISFNTDLNDEYTIDNFTGTNVEIKTIPQTIINKNAVLLKGLDEVQLNVALGNRKDSLNPVETYLKNVGGFIDNLTGIFGGGTSLASKVQNKIGALKVSTNWTTLPKMLYLSGGQLPTNHRSLFNAKYLYDNFHNYESFVLNGYFGQKKVYNGVRIPFGFSDYQQLSTNSYFYFNGKQAKITKFVWIIGEDAATIDFWVREPYTFNLTETILEP
jgi:hypothetical protein